MVRRTLELEGTTAMARAAVYAMSILIIAGLHIALAERAALIVA
jgi:hypothetical protein